MQEIRIADFAPGKETAVHEFLRKVFRGDNEKAQLFFELIL